MAFNLINEPRCYKCGDALRIWAEEMSAYVKTMTRQLVTIGAEVRIVCVCFVRAGARQTPYPSAADAILRRGGLGVYMHRLRWQHAAWPALLAP